MERNLVEFLLHLIKDDLAKLGETVKMDQVAALVPSVHKIAFEFPLLQSNQVDFHLNIPNNNFLHSFSNSLNNTEIKNRAEWSPLLLFLEEWGTDKTQLNSEIKELFLEFDCNAHGALQLPSLFAKVKSKNKENLALLLSEKIVKKIKGTSFFDANKTVIENSISQAPMNSSVSHLGLMLSRPQEVVRINLSNVSTTDLCAFLSKNGWQGNENLLIENHTFLLEHTDTVVVSFDSFHNKIMPRIGLEAFMDYTIKKAPKWQILLDKLLEKGLCCEEKRDIILNWNKEFYPTKNAEWHETLILNSLHKEANEFSVLRQIPSHVKFIIENDSVMAKGYLGFGQTWITK
jgi:hypothetical protein